jgi:hypothetical protein
LFCFLAMRMELSVSGITVVKRLRKISSRRAGLVK